MANLSRRDILKLTALSLGTLLIARCTSLEPQTPTLQPDSTLTPSLQPELKVQSTAERLQPTPTVEAPVLPTETDILIVGAGMAGLSAAKSLKELGYDVIVLEARQRTGGRIWTDHTLGLPLDIGASWIHGVKANPLTQLADEVGAERVKTDYDSLTIFNTYGAELSASEVVELEKTFDDLMTRIEFWQEDFESDVSLQKAIDQYLNNKHYSDDGMRKLVYAINTEIEHEYAADVQDLSLYWFDDAGEFDGGDVIFPMGYEQLTRPLIKGLDIRLEETVRQVEYNPDGIRILTANREYTARKAILTLPAGVLQSGSVQFKPALPDKKQNALKLFGSGVLNKVYLQFSEVFWDADTHLIGYVSEKKGQWCEWLNLNALLGQPVLLAFNAGAYGHEIEALSDKEILSQALLRLGQMLGKQIPEPIGWLITRWGQDPFALGSYSSLKPGATPNIYDDLAKPVDKVLFFAGEATHRTHPATVHGAYLSGQRAAKELDESW